MAALRGRSDDRLSVGIDLHRDDIRMVSSLGSSVSRDTLPTLDYCLFHPDGTMRAM
jgi:hypothetical protein